MVPNENLEETVSFLWKEFMKSHSVPAERVAFATLFSRLVMNDSAFSALCGRFQSDIVEKVTSGVFNEDVLNILSFSMGKAPFSRLVADHAIPLIDAILASAFINGNLHKTIDILKALLSNLPDSSALPTEAVLSFVQQLHLKMSTDLESSFLQNCGVLVGHIWRLFPDCRSAISLSKDSHGVYFAVCKGLIETNTFEDCVDHMYVSFKSLIKGDLPIQPRV